MGKKKPASGENYLERIPLREESIFWSTGEDGRITFKIENTGWMNRIAQKVFRRPKNSFVHLDEMGSFIWPLLSEEKSLIDLGRLVEDRFGEAVYPLYERLAQYVNILESYHFITWK